MKNKFKQLEKLLDNAVCTYSKYHVAAIVIDKKGNEYSGVNVENATYNIGICAERNAIYSAITTGLKWGDIKEVHILAKNAKLLAKKTPISTPCGPCRQIISESSNGEAVVYTYDFSNKVIKEPISKLLPKAFGHKDL